MCPKSADRRSRPGHTDSGKRFFPNAASAVKTAASAPAIALDDEPDIDLVDNRYLWHLYRGGLIIPVAGEGLRKYSQQYRDPWRKTTVLFAGKRARFLDSRRATLRFPWAGRGGGTLRLRLHGIADQQRLTISLNGRRLQRFSAPPSWQVIDVELPASALRSGENSLVMEAKKRGRVGRSRAYAAFHSIEIATRGTEMHRTWPRLSPAALVGIDGGRKPSLVGFEALAINVEIPKTAWLSVATGIVSGAARFRITARTVEGSERVLLDHAQDSKGWQQHHIPLTRLADRLVRLQFSTERPGGRPLDRPDDAWAWGRPRIQLEAATRRQRPPPVRNLILVVVDALRSDRLAVYEKTRVRTPRITRESTRRGVAFLYSQAASPSSPPSHGSIQTGMIPRVHGVTGDKAQLKSGTPMISTVLGARTISTGYYGNNAFGMARLEKPGRWTAYHQPSREGLGIDCKPLVEQILSFTRKQARRGKRFFVSSLPYETHVPYRYHEGITDRYYAGPYPPPLGKSVSGDMLGRITGGSVKMNESRWAQLKALYDGEAEYMDGCFGQLLDGLAGDGLIDQTAIILTSDHGEGMYEHGRMGHAFGHYAELADIPIILFVPGLVDKGMRLPIAVSHIDIAPTVLDLMGVDIEPRMQGESLLPLVLRRGPWTPRVVSLEYGRSFALRAQRWKYIVDYAGNESLFDLQRDPDEQTDLVDARPLALRYMRDLTGFFLVHRSRWRVRSWGTLNNHGPGFIESIGADETR
ncbi:MAG: sulfatase-like hydrolase/transferase [Proteobacteria bacterium]|nr:sulfatase-like hydrolase/transferase [Pseudomonadota bacterium]